MVVNSNIRRTSFIQNDSLGLIFKKRNPANLGVAFFLLSEPLFELIHDIFYIVSVPAFYSTYIQLFIYFVLLLNALPVIMKRINRYHVGFLLIFLLTYLTSVFISSHYELHSTIFLTMLLRCLPLFALSVGITDYKDLFRRFSYVSYLIALSCFIAMFISRTAISSGSTYSQEYGYWMVFPFMYFTTMFLTKLKLRHFLLTLICLFMIVASGARGPIVCSVAGFLLAVAIIKKTKSIKIWIYLIGLVSFLVLVLVFYDYFSAILTSTFEKLGMSTRTVEKIISGNFNEDSSRLDLFNASWNYISNHLFFGTGMGNERVFLFEKVRFSTIQTMYGTYSHNLFLELMMQFGLIPGLFLSLLLFFMCLKTLIKKSNSIFKQVNVILFSYSLLILLLSRSYLNWPWFYFYIGFLITLLTNKKWFKNV